MALEVEARTDGAGGGAGRGLSVAERQPLSGPKLTLALRVNDKYLK